MSTKVQNSKRGYLMLAVLWFAYVTFVMNWVAGSSLTPQITDTFFGGPVDPLISEVVNYSITTARVFANILAAVVIMRLGPKKAAGLSIGLLMMGLVAIYIPNYWGYIFARMIMAMGGSMIIVYMNPFVSNYVSNPKVKLGINAANTATYNIGTFIVAVLFTLFAEQLVTDWQLTMTFFASITVILFVVWLIGSEDFKVEQAAGTEEYGYKHAFKDGFIWRFGLAFASFLTLYVLALVSFKNIFDQYTLLDGSVTNLLISGGALIGTLAGIAIGNKGWPRKPTLLMIGIGMVSTFAFALVFANSVPSLSYVLLTISGFFMFLQYPIFLNLPHEMKNMSPHKLTIMFGLFWAIAYAGQTIANIVWSYILGAFGYVPSMIFFIAFASLYCFLIPTLPETKQKDTVLKNIA